MQPGRKQDSPSESRDPKSGPAGNTRPPSIEGVHAKGQLLAQDHTVHFFEPLANCLPPIRLAGAESPIS